MPVLLLTKARLKKMKKKKARLENSACAQEKVGFLLHPVQDSGTCT